MRKVVDRQISFNGMSQGMIFLHHWNGNWLAFSQPRACIFLRVRSIGTVHEQHGEKKLGLLKRCCDITAPKIFHVTALAARFVRPKATANEMYDLQGALTDHAILAGDALGLCQA